MSNYFKNGAIPHVIQSKYLQVTLKYVIYCTEIRNRKSYSFCKFCGLRQSVE